MKYVIGSFLLFAALAAGNPVVETVVNEFGFDDNGLGWVELHAEPLPEEVNMHGWLLTTNTSVCTLDYVLQGNEFLIVDSASLAFGDYGRGTFRLDPAGDTIRLSEGLQCWDEVVFPALPADWGRAPMPPAHGSASVLNVPQGYAEAINWYIDSTPTPEWYNDDYSTVTGVVTWAPGRNFYCVVVVVSGPMGASATQVLSGRPYEAPGLGAGRYEVYAFGQPGGESVIYPESVDVGYSRTVGGINLDFDPQGLEESREPTAPSRKLQASVIRGVLFLPSPYPLPAGEGTGVRGSVLADISGRRAMALRPGANDVSGLAPGVYFVGEGPGVRGQGSGRMRKVLVTR